MALLKQVENGFNKDKTLNMGPEEERECTWGRRGKMSGYKKDHKREEA